MTGYILGKIFLPTSIAEKRKLVAIWRLHLSSIQSPPDLRGKTATTSTLRDSDIHEGIARTEASVHSFMF